MSRNFLMIDGYNLMHAAGIARRKYGPGQLERCRSRLLRHLARHLSPLERERTTVVFDAADAPADLARTMVFEGMQICFADPGKEADDTIEALIAVHSAPRQIRLVSSDHRLQKSVRRRRGMFVDSEDFADELERRGPVSTAGEISPAASQQSTRGSKDVESDTDEWLRIFGDSTKAVDVQAADIENSDVPLSQADVAALEAEIARQEVRPRSRAARRRSKKGI